MRLIVCQGLLLAGAKNRYGVRLLETKITDDKSQFAVVSIAELGVAQPAFDFTNQLTAFAGKPPLKRHQRVAAELINDVLFQPSIETRFLLGIVAIETLCAPSKQKKEGNSKCCQRVIQRYLNNTTADSFAKLYTKRNDFAHEGFGKGVLDREASEARQIATELLLAQI